jgi:prepilin peptidase CpaA
MTGWADVHFSLVYFALVLLLATAAVTDFVWQRIPNWIVLVLLALFVVQAARHFGSVSWLDQLGAGALLLVVGFVLYFIGQFGAGDAKLTAVLALWIGFSAILPSLMLMSFAGLALAAIIVALRYLPWRRLDPGNRRPKALMKGGGIPFGVAIAAGTLLSTGYFVPWLWT